ncbi:enoyl-CoA hydratase-related protein [Frankia sp. AgKG'84/4]|uniref:enoyl-CoA hydratase-related protein n=1 Tax=Frankia sp. AgKG'84/4 TaxID=573490 RepID=UPI002010AC85|nr:enoyl-CoA hydratase-related protein [Frankia sp. AgKG'84/4]MCL9794079.1 enoyl-CoA hydratase-related protein [Frankia sp. AgKG'84/4]
MPSLTRDGEVWILHLDADDENRFHPFWLDSIEAALDKVESADGPRAMITAGSGKYWSNGLHLDWLVGNTERMDTYLDRVHRLFARTLASPVITVAAVNGHAFAAGAMWALAHDVRLMRRDRGYFCLPEVDIDLPFTTGMSALIRSRLTPAAAHLAMTTGHRYGGEAALAAGIVDGVADVDGLLAAAVDLARPLAAKAKPTRAQIKETLYAETLAALRAPSPIV